MVVCTFANTRNQGSIQLVKSWSGTKGNVTLHIGTAEGGSQTTSKSLVGANGATDQKTVDTGTYYVSETADSPTSFANYATTLSCFNDNGGTTGIANNGIKDGDEPTVAVTAGTDAVHQGSVPVGTADVVVCTFANTRNQGSIQVKKTLVPSSDVGRFNLYIKDSTGTFTLGSALNIGDGGLTPKLTLDTGTYQVSETAAGATNMANYSSTLSCKTNGGTGTVVFSGSGTGPFNVTVSTKANILCVFTNTKTYHPGTIGFWKNWRNHYTSAQLASLINYLKTNNASLYNQPSYPLTQAVIDAIFDVGTSTPANQMILAQLTALKLNLAITALQGQNGLVQYNSNICLTGTLNVASIAGATTFFGTATPTISAVVSAVEGKWNGHLTTNRSNWSFNVTKSQQSTLINVLTGTNEGWLVVSGC